MVFVTVKFVCGRVTVLENKSLFGFVHSWASSVGKIIGITRVNAAFLPRFSRVLIAFIELNAVKNAVPML